jgi:hypothetical protein
MAKANRKKAANRKANRHRKAGHTKRNTRHMNAHRPRRGRRNPEWIGSGKEIATSAVSGLAAAVLTRQVPQLALGSNNTGIKGYAANAVVAGISAWLAGKFAGPSAGKAALVGGSVILLDRILTEQVSPIGPYLQLSGVGDATAMTRHMGTIRTGYYTHPGLVDPSGTLIAPDPYTAQAVQAVVAAYPQLAQPIAAAASSKVSGVHAVNPSELRRHTASGQVISSRFQGRFNQSLN